MHPISLGLRLASCSGGLALALALHAAAPAQSAPPQGERAPASRATKAPLVTPDAAPRLLAERITSGATLSGHGALAGPGAAAPRAGAANVLWTHQALDNAACVRGAGDLDGDGIADAVSGHDISGTADNLFALSGASAGSASALWSIETQGGASGGSFWGDDCVSVASDHTGDGVAEILGAVAWGGRTANCFDGSSGALLWQLDTYNEPRSGWVYSIHEMPDVTGDGVPEVIFGCGSDNDSVYCVDGNSRGTTPVVLWSFRALDAVYSVAWVPDVSGDGRADVVAGSGDNDGRIYCLRSDVGTPLWVHDPGGTVYSLATIQDVDGDGARDVVAAVWNTAAAARCISSATGQPLWSQPNVGGVGMKVAALRDASGDGIDEVLVGSWNNAVLCLDGATGAVRWSVPTGTTNGGDVWTVAPIPDVDGDGIDDALGGSFDTFVYAVSGREGTTLWSHATGNRVFSVHWVGDADGDGKPEALCGTQDTTSKVLVYAIEGDSGRQLPYLVRTGVPRTGEALVLHTTGLPAQQYGLFLAFGVASIPLPPFGTLLLAPGSLFAVRLGLLPVDGTADDVLPVPANPALVGATLHFQSLVGTALVQGVGQLTNRASATLQ